MGIGGAGLILSCAGELPATSTESPAPAIELPACEDVNLEATEFRTPWAYVTDAAWRVSYSFQNAAQVAGVCPEMVDDGDYVALTGPCDDGSVAFSGEWTLRRSTGRFTMSEVVWTGPWGLQGHGALVWSRSGEAELFTADIRLDTSEQLDLRGLSSSRSADGAHAGGRLAHDGNSWCLDMAIDAAPDCPGEPDGYWVLRGAQEWMLVYDGSWACDGCGYLYVDGVLREAVCALLDPLEGDLDPDGQPY